MAGIHDLITEARTHRDAATSALDEMDVVEARYRLGHLDAVLDRMAVTA